MPLQGSELEAQWLWGVRGHPWKLRCVEGPPNSEGENQMEEYSSCLPPPAKAWVGEHLLTPRSGPKLEGFNTRWVECL